MFRGQFDAAPFASVFFLFLIFLLLNSALVFTPGVHVSLELPEAGNLPGATGPTVAVAVDRAGHFYFENQVIDVSVLQSRLRGAVQKFTKAGEPVTLVIQADKAVAYEVVVKLAEMARAAGIKEVVQATRPSAPAPANAAP
jgi:biopolymer transport protein ExbD